MDLKLTIDGFGSRECECSRGELHGQHNVCANFSLRLLERHVTFEICSFYDILERESCKTPSISTEHLPRMHHEQQNLSHPRACKIIEH
jgi:hypothetical protein